MEIAHPMTAIILIIAFIAVIFLIERIRKGVTIRIRKLPVLEEIDEAMGRAAEMGRPIMCNVGRRSLEEAGAEQTLAGIEVVRYVAAKSASLGVRAIYGILRASQVPLVEEAVKLGCEEAGKPEAIKSQDIIYLSEQQFGGAAAYVGLMTRENIASHVMIGRYDAESLILAMAGHQIGCYQICGTASTSQAPYLIPTADFMILGEEVMAASAILSQDPEQIAAVVSHDVIRVIGCALLLIGVILASLGVPIQTILKGWI